MPQGLTNENSTLVQVMDRCREEPIHYPSQFRQDPCHTMASLGHSELNGPYREITPGAAIQLQFKFHAIIMIETEVGGAVFIELYTAHFMVTMLSLHVHDLVVIL